MPRNIWHTPMHALDESSVCVGALRAQLMNVKYTYRPKFISRAHYLSIVTAAE